MTPNEVIVTERTVFVQWTANGPFVGLHDDGTVSEQFRTPGGRTVLGGSAVSTTYSSQSVTRGNRAG